MKTLLINLDDSIADLKTVEAFLYPLLKNNQLIIIEPKRDNNQIDLIATSLLACRQLRHLKLPEWQLIFLIPIAGSDAYSDSLAAKLDRLNSHCLPHLNNCGRPPKHRYLIALDDLERNSLDNAPSSCELQKMYEIDKQGYITVDCSKQVNSKHEFPFFTTLDFNKLNKHWDSLSGLSYANQTVDKGLSDIKNNKIKKTIERANTGLTKELEDLITNKKTTLAKLQEKQLGSNFGDSTTLDTLLENFIKDVDGHLKCDSITELGNTIKPDSILKTHLRQHFSVSGVNNENFICLRLPKYAYSNSAEEHQSLHYQMRLVYLLIFLCQHGDSLNISSNKYWLIDTIDIQWSDLGSLIKEYCQSLKDASTKNEDEQKQALKGVLQLAEDRHCFYHNVAIGQKQFTKAPKISTYKKWEGWINDIGSKLNQNQENAKQGLSQCRDTIQGSTVGETGIEIDDIKSELDKLKKTYKTKQQNLQNKVYQEPVHNWFENIKIKQLSRSVKALFAAQPGLVQIFLTGITGLFIIAIPYFLTLDNKEEIVDFLKPQTLYYPLLTLTSVVVIAIWLHWRDSIKKTRFITDALTIAKRSGKNIEVSFESSKRYILDLCELGVASVNYRHALACLETANKKQKKIRFHQQELGRHIDFANKFTLPSQIVEHAEIRQQTIIYSRPVFQNDLYAPASQCEMKDVSVTIGAANCKEYQSSLLPALKEISIKQDTIFNIGQ